VLLQRKALLTADVSLEHQRGGIKLSQVTQKELFEKGNGANKIQNEMLRASITNRPSENLPAQLVRNYGQLEWMTSIEFFLCFWRLRKNNPMILVGPRVINLDFECCSWWTYSLGA
jgi:hypothetical protein